MRSLPSDTVAYRRTAEFSELTTPAALRKEHATKVGVWARICVLEGRLRYRIHAEDLEEHVLSPGSVGVVAPEVPHEVEPIGHVRFFVEFLRRVDE